ncbi:hypothetical protein HUK80_17495 [Flavobacterium sp. MAH-1]|uniref:YD repeat-containing protein n=1 Tax=Flavobacterium agri TaxID=2743471 RepID=A0A7Y9C7T8_9FLAO|nr:hypothetical protein [Flavobacterium agri]NUY82701.1 hypothetical protein [Flavobacterium agri]NYA72724.1 hypothetical protein [Flavobacterium agri]
MKKVLVILSVLMSQLLSAQFFGEPTYGTFKPLAEKKYVVTCWVSEEYAQQQLNYTHTRLKISFLRNLEEGQYPNYNYSFSPSGPIIDGWQRITGIIEIPPLPVAPDANTPADELAIVIYLDNDNNSTVGAYFDDVRFYPYNGNMKSFVYDEDNRRLMAELDENNYATFYEYDLEGGLIRVKKETENGVYTIQETRSKTAR